MFLYPIRRVKLDRLALRKAIEIKTDIAKKNNKKLFWQAIVKFLIKTVYGLIKVYPEEDRIVNCQKCFKKFSFFNVC